MRGMDARNVVAGRQARRAAERLATGLQPNPAPSLGDVFRQGFLHGSLLQLAVCTPARRAATRKYSAVYVNRLGETVRREPVARAAAEAETVSR